MTDVIPDVSRIMKIPDHVQALKGITLSLRKGRVYTLLGGNGTGKSTLMEVLVGAYPPTQGTITLHDEIITINNPQHSRQLGTAVIFQKLGLSNSITVAENTYADDEPRRLGIINSKEMLADCQNPPADLGISLDPLEVADNMPMVRKQLVEVAKALSYAVDVVIMNEPTSPLSDNETEVLFNITEKLEQRGYTVIYISYRIDEIMRISDDISVIRDGEYIATHEKKNNDIQRLIAQMADQEMKNIWPARLGEKPNENIPAKLEVRDLSYPSLFREVSSAARPGGVPGFFGLAGAGRSDVMKVLSSLVSHHGTVLIDSKEVRIVNPKQAIDHGIALVTENRKEEGLVLMHDVNINTHHVAFQYNASRMGLIDRRQEEAETLQSIARMSTKVSSVHQIMGVLSGNDQQKIALLKWLEKTPRILLLDGPTHEVDVGAKLETYDVIRQLATAKIAIILVPSELPEVMAFSDRPVAIRNKTVADIYSYESLMQIQVMIATIGVC